MSTELCPVCGSRMDPVLAAQGWDRHPGCEFPELAIRRRYGRRVPLRRQSADLFPPSAMQGGDDGAVQRAAARLTLPRTGTRRREVYELLRRSRHRGMTFGELSEATGWTYSQIGPRVRELAGANGLPRLVADGGFTRPGPTGAAQTVYLLREFTGP